MKRVQYVKNATRKVTTLEKVQHEKKKHKVKKMQHGKSDKSKIGEKKEHKTSALECANV